MSFTIEEIIKRHRELTQLKAAMQQTFDNEVKPISEKIDQIEAYLLARMNQEGVQNYKTDHGTAYQSKLTSVKMEDPIAFRDFVLTPAIDRILDVAIAMGANGVDKTRDSAALLSLIGTMGLWDLADFRPGKKGVQKYIEEKNQNVPGVTLSQMVNLNVRGS